jgi:cytochrome c2
MKKSGIVWSPETLSKYLASPKTFIPGNKMPFPGLKNQTQRDDLMAYLTEATK